MFGDPFGFQHLGMQQYQWPGMQQYQWPGMQQYQYDREYQEFISNAHRDYMNGKFPLISGIKSPNKDLIKIATDIIFYDSREKQDYYNKILFALQNGGEFTTSDSGIFYVVDKKLKHKNELFKVSTFDGKLSGYIYGVSHGACLRTTSEIDKILSTNTLLTESSLDNITLSLGNLSTVYNAWTNILIKNNIKHLADIIINDDEYYVSSSFKSRGKKIVCIDIDHGSRVQVYQTEILSKTPMNPKDRLRFVIDNPNLPGLPEEKMSKEFLDFQKKVEIHWANQIVTELQKNTVTALVGFKHANGIVECLKDQGYIVEKID